MAGLTALIIVARKCFREGTASRGLRLLYEIWKMGDYKNHPNHGALVLRMRECMVRNPWFQFETALSHSNQQNRRARYPLEADRAEARGETFFFRGDSSYRPPLAWVTEWRGRYINRYGEDIPHILKLCGHVFWDEKRLVRSKGMDLVWREREEMFRF